VSFGMSDGAVRAGRHCDWNRRWWAEKAGPDGACSSRLDPGEVARPVRLVLQTLWRLAQMLREKCGRAARTWRELR
jgi:hypothetical protein